MTDTNDALYIELTSLLAPIGYELVHVEVIRGRGNILRVYIDRLNQDQTLGAIGIEDCVKVTKFLDEPLEASKNIEALFKNSPYELEVSSPGIERPLRKPTDYNRFSGRDAKVNVYRPLTAEELGNPKYFEKNPKQKNFIGVLKGVNQEKVVLTIQESPKQPVQEIYIPLSLISKAHLVMPVLQENK